MSESSTVAPGEELEIRQTTTGVTYAASSDLPGAVRWVIEGLQAPAVLDREVSWDGPGPGNPDIDLELIWDAQAQEVTYSVRGAAERTAALPDLGQVLDQDWSRYHESITSAEGALRQLDAILQSTGIDTEETFVSWNPVDRVARMDLDVTPWRQEPTDAPTPGMTGTVTVTQVDTDSYDVSIDLGDGDVTLSVPQARDVLEVANREANTPPSQAAWEALRPYTSAFKDRGLMIEDPVLRPGRLSVQVLTPPQTPGGPSTR